MPTGFAPDALRRMLHVEVEAPASTPTLTGLWATYDEIKPEVMGASSP